MVLLAFLPLLFMWMLLASVIRGYVLTYLWAWFMVPFGLPHLSVAWAIGVSMIVSYLAASNESSNSDSDKGSWNTVLISLIAPFITLLIGYIVHLCM